MSGSTSRVRDIGRHYPSGWSKRKAKEDTEKDSTSDFKNSKNDGILLEIPVGQKAKNTPQLLKLM